MEQRKSLQNKKRKGFTLVELIVVIAVLAILSVLAVVAFQNVQSGARTAAINADAARLASHINMFEATTGGTWGTDAGVLSDSGSHSFTPLGTDIVVTIEINPPSGDEGYLAAVQTRAAEIRNEAE